MKELSNAIRIANLDQIKKLLNENPELIEQCDDSNETPKTQATGFLKLYLKGTNVAATVDKKDKAERKVASFKIIVNYLESFELEYNQLKRDILNQTKSSELASASALSFS